MELSDVYKFSYFIDEGITNFWAFCFSYYGSTQIGLDEVVEMLNFLEEMKLEKKITIDKNILFTGDISDSQKNDFGAAVDFNCFLIREYGYSSFLSYISYLYEEDYDSLNQIYSDCFEADFNSVLNDWHYK